MLPGRKYTPADIGRILLSKWWLILLTFGLGSGLALGVSKRLPNRYRSETLIMLVPQRISDSYVKAAVTPASIGDRLNSLEDQILNRSRLEKIINDLHLYEGLLRTMPMEDVVQRMRDNDISVKVEGKESFRVSYISHDAKTAQQTTERLASLFIEESIRDRENVTADTTQFLEAQLLDAKRRLLDHEKRLEEYRSRYGGELSTQTTSNLQGIQNAQVQLQTLAESTDRARERRLNFERQLAELQSDAAIAAATQSAPAPAGAGVATTAAQQLQGARNDLDAALARGETEDHPDVKTARRKIKDLQAKVDAEERSPATAPAPVPDRAPTATERLRQQRIRDLKLQMDDIDRQLSDKQEQEQKLTAVVSDYQAKLDAAPKRESDLTEMMRDYSTLKMSYDSLLQKQQDAKLAGDLERRNIGEQFKILDPARAPERPFSPNRPLIDVGGAAGGLVLGLLLIALLEYRDSTFKTEEDVVRVLNVRVLALIPAMAPAERKPRFPLVGKALVLLMSSSGAVLALWRLRL
jgi:polysaccharide chain length determinant protein (PEP-CTERM system associated)